MVTRRIQRKHEVEAWVGDEERLNRLVRLLRKLLRDGPDHETELVATATERGSVTLRGDTGDVFNEMDRSALHSLELEVSLETQLTKRDQVRVAFDRVKGVALESRGETEWVDEVHASLVEELDRGKPWWTWLRAGPAVIILMSMAYAGTWVVTGTDFLLNEGDDPLTTGSRIGWTIFLGTMFGGFLVAGIMTIIRRILPGFEVVYPGESGRGTRALMVLGTVMLAAIGVAATVWRS